MGEHVLITCIVPKRPNEGSLCSAVGFQSQVGSFESLLTAAFGGYTVSDGYGAWVEDEGRVTGEDVRIYTIDATFEHEYETAEIVSGLRFQICTRFDQRAAYVAVTQARYGHSIGVGTSNGSGALYKTAERRRNASGV